MQVGFYIRILTIVFWKLFIFYDLIGNTSKGY